VARVHRAREDAHDFAAALLEVRHHHADPPAALFQPRARPVRRRSELVARGRERNPDVLRGFWFGPAFENGWPEEIPRLRRQDVETERDELRAEIDRSAS